MTVGLKSTNGDFDGIGSGDGGDGEGNCADGINDGNICGQSVEEARQFRLRRYDEGREQSNYDDVFVQMVEKIRRARRMTGDER
uniref:Uncharacterized protein n=1 Tax=Angiostrongylus cantonensis TaxID=6313 RepID=A0A0K0CTL1_ANGCA